MKFNDAKDILLEEGYRIIGEDFEDDSVYGDVPVDDGMSDLPVEGEGEELDSDIFGAIEQGLGDEGFDPQETADIMTNYTDKINELIEKGVEAEDIVKILAYENCPTEDDEEPVDDVPVEDGEDLTDVPVDEAYMTEGKSKGKSDRFAHREKAAYKKKKQCCDEEDDDDLDENYDLYEGKSKPKSDKFAHKEKVAGKKPKGCCGKKGCKNCEDDDDLDEAFDNPALFREPRGQVGTDNWDDFKDDFRAKSLFLKKALTPKFVSGVIKDSDFETDEKEIKAYAFSIIEDVFGTKNPVENIQARVRKHFIR